MAARIDLAKARKRVAALEQQRSTFEPLYKDLTDLFLPHRGRFNLDDVNDGKRRDTGLYNNTPLQARRVLAAGMMSGNTSPATQWFRLTTGDVKADRNYDVRVWLAECSDILYRVFAVSNLYNSLQTYYNELATFGTAVMAVYEDDENFLRFETETAGRYALGLGAQGKVESFCSRRKEWVSTIVKEYGLDNCPRNIRNMWENGQETELVEVIKLVEPNDDRDKTSPFVWDKPYRSITWATGCTDSEGPLRSSGYDEFPYLCARWDIAPGDIYGTDSPALLALGDAKALQLAEDDTLTIMDRVAKPPMIADQRMRKALGDYGPRPGRTYYTDDLNATMRELESSRTGFRDLAPLLERYERRIKDAFYVDLFMAMLETDRREITAREVAERHEEKLLQLGPVLERLHNESLDPLISRSFNVLQRRGVLPDPPEALVGRELRVEYMSVMAQAQRMSSVQTIERFAQFAGMLAQFDPSAVMSLDVHKALADFADIMNVNPDDLRSPEQVAAMMQQQQQQQQGQLAMEMAQKLAGAAKDASQADVTGDNGLTRAAQNFAAAQGQSR